MNEENTNSMQDLPDSTLVPTDNGTGDGAGAPSADDKNDPQSEISMKQFMDLLKIAYQVQGDMEGFLVAKGMTDMVEWLKLLNGNDSHSKTGNSEDSHHAEHKIDELEQRLCDHVTSALNEGIMDSVLPLLAPETSPTSKKSSLIKVHSSANTAKKKSALSVQKTDSEVEIHVCDEVKDVKKVFVCNATLLVEHMGYFADVTKEQRLEGMEISVHCDINIFDWLMRWMHRDHCLEGDGPVLEIKNVLPILVSASFLSMDVLVDECLAFFHTHINEVVQASSSMSSLNDKILTRLAAMYTNVEVELIKDRKDKIQAKLYCKLIQSLCDVDPEALRGHFCSMGKMFRCRHCQQLINPKFATQIPCVPHQMRILFDGSIRNHHQRDPKWDINDYVLKLHKSLKSWRKVYWRLWGTCHFLFCTICKKYFPVKQEGWCRYHPDVPQFFMLDSQKPSLPVGRFPCCGERAYRFQILEDRNGCQFRHHTVSNENGQDADFAAILEKMRSLVTESPPKLVFPDRLTRLIAREANDSDSGKLETREVFWWDGLVIVPPRPKLGDLTDFSASRHFECADNEDCLTSDEGSTAIQSSSSCSDSFSEDSEESTGSTAACKNLAAHPQKKKAARSGKNRHLWQLDMSTRSNQDMQRTNEEARFKNISLHLNEKTKLDADMETTKHVSKTMNRKGGTWVRLEAEFREKYSPMTNKSKVVFNGKLRKPNRVP